MDHYLTVLAFLLLVAGSAVALRGLLISWIRGSGSPGYPSSPSASRSPGSARRPGRVDGLGEEPYRPAGRRDGREPWNPYRRNRSPSPDEAGVYRPRPRDPSEGPPEWNPYAEGQSRAHRVRAARHGARPSLPNYYDLLGLERGATDDEIERAYRRRAAQIHPDRFFDDPERRVQAEAELKQLNEAMRLLRDPTRRARYDGLL